MKGRTKVNGAQVATRRYGLRSLRSRILMFAVVLTQVSLSAVSLLFLGISYVAGWDDVLERQQASARHLANEVGTVVGEMQQALVMVGQTSNWQALDPSEQDRLIDKLYAYRESALSGEGFGAFDEVLLLDREGRPVAGRSSSRTVSLAAWGEEVRSVFETVMQGQGYQGPVYVSSAQRPTMNVAVPTRDLSGRITGLLWAAVALDKALLPVVSEPGLTDDLLVYVFDEQGYLIVRNDDHVTSRQQPLGDLVPLQKVYQGFGQGIGTYLGMRGKKVIGAWQAVEGLGWTVAVEASLRLPFAHARRLLMPAVALTLVSIGVAVAAGTFISRRLTQPLERLCADVEIVSAGNLDHHIEVCSQDEIGGLAQAFDQMAISLKALRAEIERSEHESERRVEERTAGLQRLTRDLEVAVKQSYRRTLRLETAAHIAQAVNSVLDPDELLGQVVGLIADRFGFYHVGIFLLDDTSQYAILRAANSEGGQQMLARGHRLRVGEQGIVGYVADVGRPRIALDVGIDAVYFDNPDLPLTRSEMALPLVARGQVLGALDVQSVEPQAFDHEDVVALQTLADQIAVALDNARLFEQTQAALREVESTQARYAGQVWRAAATVQESRAFEYTRSGVLLPDDQLLQEADRVIGSGDANVTSDDGDNQMPSSLIVPLELHGQTIGVLGFREAGPGRVWTEDEVALANAAAYEIAQVLESAHLFEEAKKR
ncbi:MAG: GAF domain-containing protein, partial [Anaerolineae bacterium]